MTNMARFLQYMVRRTQIRIIVALCAHIKFEGGKGIERAARRPDDEPAVDFEQFRKSGHAAADHGTPGT